MPKPVYRGRMRGKPVTIRVHDDPELRKPKSDGVCRQLGGSRGYSIVVKPGMEPRLMLETVVHELLHAGVWDLAEEAVNDTAKGIADALWKMGWRREVE
jgi:hypothetical protein